MYQDQYLKLFWVLSARRSDSVIFYNNFAETKQKYQINPQLFYRPFIILCAGVFHFQTIEKTAELESFITTDMGFPG